MAIDIYNSRRCNYKKCRYWTRDESGINDNDELILDTKPSGIFYAREIDVIAKDTQEFAGVWQVDTEKIHLETTDIVDDLKKNSKVEYCGDIYIVDYITEKHIHKRSEYSCKDSKITTIYLRK